MRSGEVVFFGPEEGLGEWQGPELALDAALSFAESMGFLFDDDRVAVDPDAAHRLWRGLLEAAGQGPLGGPTPAPGAPEPELLWLEDLSPPPAAVSRAVALTKFRRALANAADATPRRAP